MTSSEDMLKNSFRKIGMKYGYEKVDAEYVGFKDFKVRWVRQYREIQFQVSDYMIGSTETIMESLADTLFSNISGAEPVPYSEEMREWALSDNFIKTKQPIYLRRSRNITKDAQGTHRNLQDSMNRLMDMGLIKRSARPFISWTREELTATVGYCSTLMDTIVITSAFDDPIVPQEVIDFAVYHEYLLMDEGRTHFGRNCNFDITERENKFPNHAEAEAWINRMCLRL